MTLWDQLRQQTTNIIYRREAKIKGPGAEWKMLAGAVILQALADDLSYYGDRIDEHVYQFYADIVGINTDYITLLSEMIRDRDRRRYMSYAFRGKRALF